VGPEYIMVYVEERACIAHVEAGRDLYISTGSYFLSFPSTYSVCTCTPCGWTRRLVCKSAKSLR
jgi:hypothetical protein